MQPFLILSALFVATCTASIHYNPHPHAIHIPVIHNGVPVEPPEVQHAKAAHFAALVEASARAGHYDHHHDDGHYDGHYDHHDDGHYVHHDDDGQWHGDQHYAHGHDRYHGPIHIPVIHNGVPVETPEVQHAKAAHFAAKAAAAANAGAHSDYGHHYLHKRSLYAGPWAYAGYNHVALTHDGVPVDTPDVQAAKAEHYAAHAKALGQVAHAHGTPIDTPEVQHAKAAHFAAHAAARSSHGGYYHGGPAAPIDTPEVQHAKAEHFAAVAKASSHASYHGAHYDIHHDDDGQWHGDHHYAHGHQHYSGPIHIPVIHNGVPVEPAEVQHARAAHLSALAAASHGGPAYYGHHEDDGQYHPHYDHHY